VSRLLSRLCTLNGALPLGAPTSSSIGNIVLFRADERIQAACNVAGVTFTRWVDDLYLSGNAAPKLIGFAIRAVHDAGFRINRKKISVHGPGRRHVVAGWVVNGLLPTAPREMVSRVMADMKRIELTPGSERHKLIRSIEGSMSYLATSNSRSVKTIAARLQRLS
jgi:RNA-directed DNA polymerase